MENMSGFIRIKRSTFRKGTIILYAFFLSLIAYTFAPQLLTPKPGEKSLRCTAAGWYVGLARAAGQNCKTKCTNWEAADCSGFSSCYNKNISCTNGVDQDGRACQGCCYDCEVVCEPDPDKPPSISGSVSCSQWGKNGWCISSAKLNLTASDPQGYDLSITGNAKGTSISCGGNCSINLPSGSGVANYVVTASQSGLSASGSTSWDFDPDSPSLGLNVSGSTGQNGWYKSSVTITPTGSDSISGLAGAFVSVNNGAWQSSATLGDGKHNIDLTAADYAGNIVNSSTTILVDTTTPSISVSVKGKSGKNRWFASEPTISASASDSTSGIASFEVSVDGSSYHSYSSAITFSDGRHSVQFRAIDRAGNSTETPQQNILVDLNSPTVSISTPELSNGNIAYKAHDQESGVSSIYITIGDKDGKYPKVKWSESVSGENVTGEYKWNGKFDGGVVAPSGEYTVWIKAVDQAGNEDTQVGSIVIPETDSLLVTSTSDPSQEDQSTSSANVSEVDETNDANSSSDLTYGGETIEPIDVANQSLSASANASSTLKNPFPWGLILGATTVAAGAATYVATKSKKSKAQKQETRARLMAELEAKWEAEALAAKAANKASKMKMQYLKTERFEAKDEIDWEKAEAARQKALEKAKKDAQLKAGLAAYYNARKQGEKEAAASVPPKEKSWWEKAIDYVDQHQVEIALGVGVLAGVGAIILSGGLATPLVAAAWVAGAAVAAGGTIAIGTAALNSYYGRKWNENLGRNILLAGISAAAVSGAWFLLQGAVSSIGAYCAANTNICARVEPILNALDKVEEAGLNIKLAYQNWRGDPNAIDTALELQMEHMDGGMPGNSTATEIADLGEDAVELVSLYGDDAIPLLLKYGDDAIDIIGAYGDDGIKLLQKYGWDSIDLIKDYGTPAIKVLGAVNPTNAKKLLGALDDDVLDYAISQGDDAIRALSLWSDELLADPSMAQRLALRSGRDGKVLNDIKKLIASGPLDPTKLTKEQQELINAIAENSTQYSDEAQIVLGKWVDATSGFVQVAQETGSVHYNPHPAMWELLGELGAENQNEVAWLINQRVIQTGIDKGSPFEYTLNGIKPDNLNKEISAVEAIWKGASDKKLLQILDTTSDNIPIRMKELKELYNSGYQISFDAVTNSYVFIKP
jgi:hypothetical protein